VLGIVSFISYKPLIVENKTKENILRSQCVLLLFIKQKSRTNIRHLVCYSCSQVCASKKPRLDKFERQQTTDIKISLFWFFSLNVIINFAHLKLGRNMFRMVFKLLPLKISEIAKRLIPLDGAKTKVQ